MNKWWINDEHDKLQMIFHILGLSSIYSGWWFGTMEFYDFPFSWEFQNPNWLELHHFSEGLVETTNQVINE